MDFYASFSWIFHGFYRGPEDTPYENGVFCAVITFPKDYPLNPPAMRFTSEVFHPNVYPDGRVCISILHPPGDDPNQYESRLDFLFFNFASLLIDAELHDLLCYSSERWSPVQSVEKILLSVVSVLAEPNDESGANIEASVSFFLFFLLLLSYVGV